MEIGLLLDINSSTIGRTQGQYFYCYTNGTDTVYTTLELSSSEHYYNRIGIYTLIDGTMTILPNKYYCTFNSTTNTWTMDPLIENPSDAKSYGSMVYNSSGNVNKQAFVLIPLLLQWGKTLISSSDLKKTTTTQWSTTYPISFSYSYTNTPLISIKTNNSIAGGPEPNIAASTATGFNGVIYNRNSGTAITGPVYCNWISIGY